MDEDDRDSNAFSENDQDEVMEDVDEPDNEPDNEPEPEPEHEEDDEDAEEDEDAGPEAEADVDGVGPSTAGDPLPSGIRGLSVTSPGHTSANGNKAGSQAAADGTAVDSVETIATVASASSARNSATPGATNSISSSLTSRRRMAVRPEALAARVYDIVPTMAAPQATSINALAVTPDLRYWMTGGSDGYIRKYDGPGTINGKQLLTVAQRHPFVDSVVKAGILMSYWENEEPATTSARGAEEHMLSPVYALAVHSQALWLLAGTEGGGINLQSVRHDEGKRITCLQRHTNAVSVLQLAPDEKSVLSGSWDKNIFDWDLNGGQVRRQFDGSGGQISALEPRPASGAPIPAQSVDDEPVRDARGTLASSNAKPLPSGVTGNGAVPALNTATNGNASSGASATLNGDEAIPDHESLFGSPGGSLFGDSEALGANPFGDDDMGTAVGLTSGSAGMGDEGIGSFSQDVDMVLNGGDTTANVFEPTAPLASSPSKDALTSTEAVQPAAAEEGGGGARAKASISVLSTGDSTGPNSNEADISSTPTATGAAAAAADSRHSAMSAKGTSPPLLQPKQELQDQELQLSVQVQAAGSGDRSSPSAEAADVKPETAGQTLANADVQGVGQPSATVYSAGVAPAQFDPTQVSETTFLSGSMDGTIRIWDRRQSLPIARIGNRPGVPPWCMGACWSPDGNRIYAGRRNGIVEEFDIHKAKAGWLPERALRFPAGSGPVSAVRAMVNGRHLVCASHDILRLYDLRDASAFGHSHVPFLIIPGPPRAGVISHLYIDQSSRFLISTAGTRGWEGTSTEVLIGYEISSIV